MKERGHAHVMTRGGDQSDNRTKTTCFLVSLLQLKLSNHIDAATYRLAIAVVHCVCLSNLGPTGTQSGSSLTSWVSRGSVCLRAHTWEERKPSAAIRSTLLIIVSSTDYHPDASHAQIGRAKSEERKVQISHATFGGCSRTNKTLPL